MATRRTFSGSFLRTILVRAISDKFQINWRVLELADHATGVRLRLRLGVHSDQDGEKLAVFYKVFTMRTVVDICSMSPKVYSAEPIFRNKLRSNAPQNTQGYVRKENNGWVWSETRFLYR